MRRLGPAWLLLLLIAPARAQDPGLGRLFFTPSERQALESARRKNIRAEAKAAEAAKSSAPPVRNVTITGVVRRSDGGTVVWVNGKPVEGATEDGLKVRVTAGQQAAVIVHEPEKGRTVRLKVGQRADLVTGRVRESYERREAAAPQAAAPEPAPQPTEASGSRKREEPLDELEPATADEAKPASQAGADERG